MKSWRFGFRRWLRLAVVTVLCFAIGVTNPVSALSDYYADFFYQNGIYYYDPEGVDTFTNNCTTTSDGSDLTIIGDSITVAASEEIKKLLPQVQIFAEVSKHFGTASDAAISPNGSGNPSGISILKYLIAANAGQEAPEVAAPSGGTEGMEVTESMTMRRKIVFALGTNDTGGVDPQAVLDLVGSNTYVFFITNYNSSDDTIYKANNDAFKNAAQNSNVGLIDWKTKASEDAAQYINQTDGLFVHPTDPDGTQLWANLINGAVGGSGTRTGSTTSNYTNYAGVPVFSDSQKEEIEKNIPLYQQAIDQADAASHNITWQLIATLHYRERGLQRVNPSNGEGVFGLHNCREAGTCFFQPGKTLTDTELVEQIVYALNDEIIAKADNYDLSTDVGVKKFFLSYNGTGGGHYRDKAIALGFSEDEVYEGSPYVMNMYDEQRDPNSPNMNPEWPGYYCENGKYCPGKTSVQFGAFVIYTALGGAVGSICMGGTAIAGGLNGDQTLYLMQDYFSPDVVLKGKNGWVPGNSSDASYGPEGKINCVTFVQYFLHRFTGIAKEVSPIGNGAHVVNNITGNLYTFQGVTRGVEPRPFAVFSVTNNNEWGHTGIVTGIDTINDKIYIAQAGLGAGKNYSRDHIEQSLSDWNATEHVYAYLDSIMNLNELYNAINNGMKYNDIWDK